MKATINGIEFEGTPEEFKAFIHNNPQRVVIKANREYSAPAYIAPAPHKPQQKHKPAKKRTKNLVVRRRTGTRKSVVGGNAHMEWTAQDEQKILDRMRMGQKRKRICIDLAKELKRTKKAVHERMNRLLASQELEMQETILNVKKADAERKQPQQYAGFVTEKPVDDEAFPELQHCAEKKLAAHIFRHAAKTDGTINFAQDGYAFGIESGSDWREFCEDVLQKTEAIAAHIGYKPQLTRVGRGITISFKRWPSQQGMSE